MDLPSSAESSSDWIHLSAESDSYDADLALARRLQDEEDALSRQVYHLPAREFNCMLCFENNLAREAGVRLQTCGHSVCQDCFRHFAQLAIQNVDTLKCPQCSEPVPASDISLLCGDAAGKRYEEIEAILIRRQQGLFHCPSPDCSNSVWVEDRTQPLEFNCEVCSNSYCSRCSSPWHANGERTCLQRELDARAHPNRLRRSDSSSNSDSSSSSNSSSRSRSSDSPHVPQLFPVDPMGIEPAQDSPSASEDHNSFKKLVKKGVMRRCACGSYIEKNGGCDYVKCPACGLGFCWQCHQELGGTQPNCKHTRGHGPNPSQFQWTRAKLERKDMLGHAGNIESILAAPAGEDPAARPLPSSSSSSRGCIIS